jgi:mannosyltransferase OCH1-like enzyme
VAIPKILHQIWIGPRPAPLRWTRTWRETNPDFAYRLWNDDAIESFGLRNHDLYLRFLAEKLYDGAADVARVEILHEHGGVYVDADSVALRPIGDAPFMQAGFFAQHEPNETYPGLITNAFMGAVPHHRVLARYIEVLSRIGPLRPMWRVCGPGALSDVLAEMSTDDVMTLPWWTFFASSLWGDEELGGDPYAQHFWSTTAERWGHERATSYPDTPR